MLIGPQDIARMSEVSNKREQCNAWHAVLLRLYEQYPAEKERPYAATNRESALLAVAPTAEYQNPPSSFYMVCDTGVPHDELATAFLMIFGVSPFSERYLTSDRYLRR